MNPKTALAWSLIHFLWQGAAIALLMEAACALLARAGARWRYMAAAFALVAMVASVAGTYLWLTRPESAVAAVATVAAPAAVAVAPTVASDIATTAQQYASSEPELLRWVLYAWLAGVAVLWTRLLRDWLRLRRLGASLTPFADTRWIARFDDLVRRVGVRVRVQLKLSDRIDTPAVLGWLKPVVIVPVQALTQLSEGQVEALLAHELAHIRRHDYFVNLLQSVVETVLFYHPAVWWVGARMRVERENACDDIAAATCGNAVVYARALVELEQMRAALPALAMAARGGRLKTRIERLLEPSADARREGGRGMAALWLTAVVVFAMGMVGTPQTRLQAAMIDTAASFRASIADAVASGLTKPAEPQSAAAAKPAKEAPAAVADATEPTPAPTPEPAPASAPHADPKPSTVNFMAGLEKAGYANLDIDKLVAFKIHGVTGDFIARYTAIGWKPTPDELLALRIHRVDPDDVRRWREAGYEITAQDAIALRIHRITPDFAAKWNQTFGVRVSINDLTALRIHNARSEDLGAFAALGFKNITVQQLLNLKVMGVTPQMARRMQATTKRTLSVNDLVRFKTSGLFDEDDTI